MVISPCIVFAAYFCLKMRIEVLKVVLSKSVRVFKWITCGCVEPQKFRK